MHRKPYHETTQWEVDFYLNAIKDREAALIKGRKTDGFKMFLRYADSARKRRITFYLTPIDFDVFIKSTCVYCGMVSTGVDRIDSKIGYIRANVVPCCGMCNMSKYTYSAQEFVIHSIRIAKHQESIGLYTPV